jgi:hypothetical protein
MSRDGPRFLFGLVQRARKFSGLRVCVWNSKLIGCYSACGARVQKLKKNTTESGHARQTDDGAGLCSIGLRGPSVPAPPLVCIGVYV